MMYRVAFATGSRADYGIVRKYLEYLNQDSNIQLDILITGALLEEKYGNNYSIINDDGFNIANKVFLNLDSSSNAKVIKSMAIALEKFGEYFEKNKYDLLIILGDRYEMLSVSLAAAMNRIKILHIHGGEITLGNYDEFIRHSITKMAYYHFTSTDEYQKRVIQLGENPKNVFNIGAMGSENCKMINLNNVPSSVIDLPNKKYFVILFHPETLTNSSPNAQIKTILKALTKFMEHYIFVFIGSNADTGSNEIRKAVNQFVNNYENTVYYENLHPDGYHYLVQHSVALIGNSSSGIIEVPTLGAYTINIGDRQKGRVRGKTVIDIDCEFNEIIKAIDNCIHFPTSTEFFNPYFKEKSSQTAYDLTKKILNSNNELKEFYDLK